MDITFDLPNGNKLLTTNPPRYTYIGGSDIAAILGLSTFKDPETGRCKNIIDVYNEKVNKTQRNINSTLTRFGHHNEPFVLNEYLLATGKQPIPGLFAISSDMPYVGAQVDGVIHDEDGVLIVEAKTVNSFYANRSFGEENTDEIPEQYLVQVAYQRMITGAHRVDIPVFPYPSDLRIYTYYENKKLEKAILMAVQDLWENHILPKIPPMVTYNKYEEAAISGSIAEVGHEVLQLAETIKREKEAIRDKEEKLESLELELKKIIGPAEAIKYGNDIVATFKQSERSTLDIKVVKEKLPDVYEQYKKTIFVRQLRIK